MLVREYSPALKSDWDNFVCASKNGHFMFYRDYMEYHADRFQDASLMFYDGRNRLIGLLPATSSGDTASSHAGLSFGGVVSGSSMKVGIMLDLFTAMAAMFRQRGTRHLIYNSVPHIYHKVPAEEDLYALFRFRAELMRRDVSATIDHRTRLAFTKGRNWGYKQASRNDVAVKQSTDFETFMTIEEDMLHARYKAKPTHTAAELALLASRFPENIKLFAACKRERMLAGVVIYETATVAHTQYIGASDEGRQLGALDLIFHHLIDDYYSTKRYFDFGICTEQNGFYLNPGLVQNKESYGARGTVFDWYHLDMAGSVGP